MTGSQAANFAKHAETIPAALRNAVEHWPDKVWLDFSGDRRTFREVDETSNRIAHGLRRLGVAAGDRVCSIFDNHADGVCAWMAISKLGAVAVPINTAFRGEFLRHQLADSGGAVVLADAAYVDRILEVAEGAPELRSLVRRGPGDWSWGALHPSPFDALIGDDASPIQVEVGPDDLAMLLYTSGTTGPSKGCMIGHRYVCNMGWQSNRHLGVRHEDVYWTPCPLFHLGAAGGLIGTLQTGSNMSIYPKFSVSEFWPEMERSRATVVMLLSSMLNFVADAEETEASRRAFGQVRVIHGVPFAEDVQATWKRRFGVTYAGAVGYGMTECCSITLRDLQTPAPPGASGRRFEDFEVMVVDGEDNILPDGDVGEIVVRPRRPGIMFQGYWRRPEATIEVNRNLLFHTGDIGRLDAEGFLYWMDRKKDYLRRGGENISSYEMEVAFRAHPDIEDVAVHAVAAEGPEDEVKVTAMLRPNSTLSPEALCLWSIDRLPAFAVPRFIEFRTDFPRNGVGRILKYELRREGVTPSTWDRQASTLAVRRRAGKLQSA